MHPNRAAIFVTIGLALALASFVRQWGRISPVIAHNLHAERRLPSKVTERTSGHPARSELSALKQLAETMAADDAVKQSPEEWEAACRLLDADELVQLLQDQSLWPHRRSFSVHASNETETWQSWSRWVSLSPLRTACLERLATLDLRRGMLSFPSEATILLSESAEVNGAQTFRTWREIKDEWKHLESAQAQDLFRNNTYIEGIGVLPLVEMGRLTAEQEALAALSRGWSATDPEGAWAAVERGELDHLSPTALASLIEGLQDDADWRMWSERIGSLEWPLPRMAEFSSMSADPLTDAVTKLAQRWIRSDPKAALSWLPKVESSWAFPQGSWPINPFEAGSTSSGVQKLMSARVPIYTSWLERDVDACLERLKKDLVPDDILADIVRWTELDPKKKVQVLALIENSDLKAKLAITLATRTWDSQSMSHQKEYPTAIIDALSRLDGLDETTSARILSIKEAGR